MKRAWLEYATGKARKPKAERTTASDWLNQVVDYGGQLVRRIDVKRHLDYLSGGQAPEGPGTFRMMGREEIPGARPTHKFDPLIGDFVPVTEGTKREARELIDIGQQVRTPGGRHGEIIDLASVHGDPNFVGVRWFDTNEEEDVPRTSLELDDSMLPDAISFIYKGESLKHEHVLEVMPDESELAGRLIAGSPLSIELVEPSRNPPSRMVYYLSGSEQEMSDLIDKMYENGIEPYTAEVTPAVESRKRVQESEWDYEMIRDYLMALGFGLAGQTADMAAFHISPQPWHPSGPVMTVRVMKRSGRWTIDGGGEGFSFDSLRDELESRGVFPESRKRTKHEQASTPGPYKTALTDFDFRFSHVDGPNDVWVDRHHGELSVFVSPDGWTMYDNPDGVGDHIATGLNVATLEDALEEET